MKTKCLNCKQEHEVYWYRESDTKKTAMVTCFRIAKLLPLKGFVGLKSETRHHMGHLALEADQLKSLGITKETPLREEWSGKYSKIKQSRDQMEMMPLLRREPA
jgi:hypothetical protein